MEEWYLVESFMVLWAPPLFSYFACVVGVIIIILQLFAFLKPPTMALFKWNPYTLPSESFCIFIYHGCFATPFIVVLQMKFKVSSPNCSYSFTFFANVSDGIMVILRLLALLQASSMTYFMWAPPFVIFHVVSLWLWFII
jgi:hypothetical protein